MPSVSRGARALARQQREAPREGRTHLFGRMGTHARGRDLDRQRQPFERLRQPDHGVGVVLGEREVRARAARSIDEQRQARRRAATARTIDACGNGSGPTRIVAFPRHVEHAARRHEAAQARQSR